MSSAAAANPAQALGGFNEAAFEAFLQQRNEPKWLQDRRRDAFEIFRAKPLPSIREEEWRRTDIRPFKLEAFGPASAQQPSAEARAAIEPVWKSVSSHYATGIEHINSVVTRHPDPALLNGAVLMDLDQAVREHPELLQRWLLTDVVSPSEDPFAALHAAFWSGGTLLYVPKGVKVEAPLFSVIGLAHEGRIDLDHTLIVLEDGAEATFVRESVGLQREDTPALHAGSVEAVVSDRAQLRFVNIQIWDNATWHFSRERAVIGADASIQWTVGGLGSRLAKVNQDVSLAGKGARAQVNGVIFTTGKQHLAYFTRQDHCAPSTTSDLLYKGGLREKSRMVWKGMIRVEPEAQQTNAYQKNDNLVLSDTARADSIPGLEIEANEVRCTHGATAGRVDEEMIFYAQARGIRRETAIRLIVEGFFSDVYDRISLEPVRETLKEAVASKLHQGTLPPI